MTATSGMNISQRILHVGGRNNAAGYVEFGSIQAVEALVRQVLRDLPPADVPLLSDDEIYEMYSEPRSDAEMLEFGREVEAAVRKLFIATQQPAPVHTDGWIQDDSLLYRLTDEKRPQNRDEINVTMADGSRTIEARTRRAGELLDCIRQQPRKAVKLTDEELRDALRICLPDAVESLRIRWLYAKDFARAIEAAVLKANGVTE